ncbi:MAG TPA: alginate export family protein [Polyangiaceae bacterium]
MRRVGVAAGLVVLGWTAGAFAQVAPPAPEALSVGDWKLAPVVEARLRGEYRKDLDGTDRGVLTERARLGVDVTRGAVEGRVVFQDARLWDVGTGGDFLTGPLPIGTTGIYEAWGEAHTAGAHPSFVRVGRQPVVWGEGRLLGISDWSPTGRSLDAVRGRLVAGDWAFEVLASALEDPVPITIAGSGTNLLDVTNLYGELFGARAEWALDPLFAVELYGLARVAQSNPLANFDTSVQGTTYTGALRLHGEGHGWTWGAEGAAQAGHADGVGVAGTTARAEDRSAFASAGHVAYAFEHVALTPSIRLGGSFATGDSGGSKYQGFDPILPDVHTWYGAMDLLTWSNEIEANARVAIVPWTDGVAAVEYRYMRLAQAAGAWTSGYLATIAAPSPNASAELGHEIDATIAWSPWTPVDLRMGYAAFVLGDGAKSALATPAAPAPSLSHYAFLQASLRIP